MSLSTPAKAVYVAAGTDRREENGMMIWGLLPLSIKVSTADTGGSLFVFQHKDMGLGGPPRHIHHAQDEWFYAVEGEYVMEVGDERYRLRPGDSLLAPREVPHAWAHVSRKPGTLITAVTPAGTFEEFIRETARFATLPSPEDIAAAFAAHGMTVVGPPLDVGQFLA
jgi:mannose-6-phosphate isomerase-like protein (cupin superfamily)